MIAQADELLPGQTLQDWATYGDHLVVVHVAAEHAATATKEELDVGEGFEARQLSLVVDRVLWSRTGAPAAPQKFTATFDGWTFSRDGRVALRHLGQPTMRVGSSYLLPIVRLRREFPDLVPGWSQLSLAAVVPVEDVTLGEGDEIVGGKDAQSTAVRSLWGSDIERAATAIKAVVLPRTYAPYMHLPPVARFHAIARAVARTR